MTTTETKTWHGGPAVPTIACVDPDRLPWNRGTDWQLWIPPIGLDCYDGGTLEGALKGPWGDTYWPTQQDACEFLEQYVNTYPVCRAGHPLIVLTKGTFHLRAGAAEIQRAVVLVDAGDAGNFNSKPFWVWGCEGNRCTAWATDGAQAVAIAQADGLWPSALHYVGQTAYVEIEG